MAFLILLIIFFALFNLSFRQAQRRGIGLYVMGVVVFATGAACYLILYLLHPVPLDPQTLALAITTGVLFTFMYVLMVPTMSDRGVSVMTALQQLSLLFPLLASLLIYGERPSLVRAVGASLCLVAMPFLSLGKGLTGHGVTRRKYALFIGLMVANGLALTGGKVFQEFHVPDQLNGYMLILMAVAALGCLVSACRLSTLALPGRTLGWGVYLGLVFAFGQMFMLLTLRYYPGVLAYPISQAMNLSLVTVVSGCLWREWPNRLAWVGIALAAAAVVLANL